MTMDEMRKLAGLAPALEAAADAARAAHREAARAHDARVKESQIEVDAAFKVAVEARHRLAPATRARNTLRARVDPDLRKRDQAAAMDLHHARSLADDLARDVRNLRAMVERLEAAAGDDASALPVSRRRALGELESRAAEAEALAVEAEIVRETLAKALREAQDAIGV